MRRSRHLNPEPKSPVTPSSKKPEHASSVFWLFYWRRSCTVIFHFPHHRSTPESLAMSRGLAMYRNMQEIRRRDGICFPKPPFPRLRPYVIIYLMKLLFLKRRLLYGKNTYQPRQGFLRHRDRQRAHPPRRRCGLFPHGCA